MVRLVFDQSKVTNRVLITLERIQRNPDGMSWEEMLHFLSGFVVGDDDVLLGKDAGFDALLDMTQAETVAAMETLAGAIETVQINAVPPTSGAASPSA